jgi:flagellar hook-associated protein 1 FlgK
MSLFSAIHSSISGLNVATMGLQVVSNNVANANTPGFSAQSVNQAASLTVRRGGHLFGTGVTLAGISQSGSRLLETQLREAIGDADSSQVQSQIYQRLEAILGELGENDISTHLSRFFAALQEVAQQPESRSIRSLAIQQGQALTQKLNLSYSQAVDLQGNIHREIDGSVKRVNQLLQEVATLNQRIVAAQGGGGQGAAHSLLDSRRTALRELGSLIDLRASEADNGAVTLSTTGGSALVTQTEVKLLRAVPALGPDGSPRVSLEYAGEDQAVTVRGGRLGGLQAAADYVSSDFVANLADLSANLVFQFNKLHAAGQGLTGLTQVQGEHGVANPDLPLDRSGLPFSPTNGSLSVHVRDQTTGQVKTHNVIVNLGTAEGKSLGDLVAELNAMDGLTAQVDRRGRLQIATTDPNADFYFSDDTSGVLAALGVNTFFTGNRPGNLGVNQALFDRPELLATAAGGIGQDTQTILGLGTLDLTALGELGGQSIRERYERGVGDLAQKSALATSLAETFTQYASTLETESLSQTGVNLDEEAVKMLQYQRAYHASARVIQTANEIFEVMLRL